METTEVMAATKAIEEIKKQLAVLEGLVGTAKESVKETPVIEEPQVVNEQPEELPAPPAEVIIPDTPEEDDSPTKEDLEDSEVMKEFLKKVPGCKYLIPTIKRVEVSRPVVDNGKENPYLFTHKFQILAYDKNGKVIFDRGRVTGKRDDGKAIFSIKPLEEDSFPYKILAKMQNRFPKLWSKRSNWMPYVISTELY